MSGNNDHNIDIKRIKESLQAETIVDNNEITYVSGIYASDLMSDVLAYGNSGSILLTGLNTVQAAISAYMAEFKGIIFIRGKIPEGDTKKFAKDKGLIVLSTHSDMYEACVKIARIEGYVKVEEEEEAPSETHDNITSYEFKIDGKDFASAGFVSTQVKTVLKSIGFDPQLVRRVAISTYEAEMNVVMHADSATVILTASEKEIKIVIDDKGKGITDIEQAMKEGFSTATEEQRAMGFGAGMGLPNIKKNADEMKVESEVGVGTKIITIFYVK